MSNFVIRQAASEEGLYMHVGDFQKWLLANAMSMNDAEMPNFDEPAAVALAAFLDGWKNCLISLTETVAERTGVTVDLTE
jgi:hypothetical protein